MSDHAFVVEQISQRSLAQLEELAAKSGVPYSTVRKIARGYTDNPKAKTIEQLVDALRGERRPRRSKRGRRQQ